MGVIIPQVLTEDRASGAQIVDGSLRFDSSKSHYLTRTPSSAGNRKTWTWSGWVKRSALSTYQYIWGNANVSAENGFMLRFDNNDVIRIADWTNTAVWQKITTQVFRDVSAWYHIVISYDTTNATASDRVRFYINGSRVTSFSTNTDPTQNYDGYTNNTSVDSIGRWGLQADYYLNANISNVYLIDGQALDPSYFGYTDPLTNTWRSKKFSGVFSTPASAFYQSSTTLNWGSGTTESNWALSNSNKTATYSGSSVYSDVFTAALNSSTTYTFKLNTTVSDSFGGWFFTDSTGISGTHPNERSGNSLGLRSGTSSLGAYGTYASANSVSDGASAIAGFGDVDPVTGSSIDMVINMSARKVWVRSSGTSSWVGGGDPSNSSSTASFLLPSGTVYFAFVAYTSATITMDTLTDATGINSFYLPFDGNSPIGQDQSGNGNNWTPVNFGGSNTLEKATGALPILNTDGGGKVARVGVRTDSSASSLVLALPLVGIKSDFSNAINGGTTEKAITVSGSTATSSYSNFYGGSFDFSGTASAKYLSFSPGNDLAFGTGDFTIEAWVYMISRTTSSNQYVFDTTGGTRLAFYQGASNGYEKVAFYIDATGIVTPTTVIQYGTWQHWAVSRQSGTLRLFVDGVLHNSASNSDNITAQTTAYIGNYAGAPSGGYNTNGYIQDVRIYKGLAKYTQNFIPASTDPDILPDTPSGVSYSSNVALVPSTDGAVAFDGTGDYLSLSASADFNFGSGDFTIEFFWYRNSNERQALYHGSFGADYSIGIDFNGASNNQKLGFWASSNGSSWDIANADGGGNGITTGTPKLYGWSHIAYVRNGNTFAMYLDGVNIGSVTSSSTISLLNTDVPVIGAWWNSETAMSDVHGFISNFHIVKGTALYTSNFIPPTAPITSVANTKLLCCQSNTSATSREVGPSDQSWIPSGFTYWTAGMSSNWASSGTTTSGSNDYINVALPSSGKYYWESTVNNPSVYRILGISAGASGAGTGYTDNIFGYYYNGNPPLFLTRNSSGTTRGGSVSHGSGTGTTWASGDKLMWAWDADNDKIWFGRNGTWYASGDPVAGTNATIIGEDLSASSFYFKIGYSDGGGSLSLTTVTSANSGLPGIAANGNTAATNFNPFTANINAVRGQESGYATLNALDKASNTSLANGNLDYSTSGAGGVRSTIGMSSGKYYCEVKVGYTSLTLGVATGGTALNNYLGANAGEYGYGQNGYKLSSAGQTPYASTFTTGDIIGIAFDADNGTLAFYKNGVAQGIAFTGLTGSPYFFAISNNVATSTCNANFGQKPFKFPPPTGFQPLALANTPRPTVVRPDQYVGVTTYTGTGAARDITVGWKPDFVWFKDRDDGTNHHYLVDSVRGLGTNEALWSNLTSAEGDGTQRVQSFNYNGFSLVSGSYGYTNQTSHGYVAWCWKAGGNSNTYNINDIGYSTASAAGLTAGTITPTGASVNTKSGFSIIGYTGNGSGSQTVAHGLSKAPSFIIIKQRIAGPGTDLYNWNCYHSALGATKFISLNTTDAASTAPLFSDTAPTSTVFTLGSTTGTYNNVNNANNVTYISYCWAEIPGFSKFGSVTLSASSDDSFIWTGFRPRWFLIKGTGSTSNWIILDSTRDPFNFVDNELFANLSNAENAASSTYSFDFLSNGIKCRNQGLTGGFIYAAFAESPNFNLYGGQATAR